MPALANPRHERFARYYMRNGRASDAYRKAGYQPNKPQCVWVASSRLLRHVDVKRRIAELRKQMATRNRITVDSLIEELDADRDLARSLEQPSAAIAAVQLKARLAGLLIDRKESGAPGDFSQAQTPEDVIAAVRRDLGDAAADLLRAMHAASVAGAVVPEIATEARDPKTPLN